MNHVQGSHTLSQESRTREPDDRIEEYEEDFSYFTAAKNPSPETENLNPSEKEGTGTSKKKGAGQNHVLAPLRALLIRSESGPLNLRHRSRLEEDRGLAKALGLDLLETHVCRLRRAPHPATFLGKGWVERIQKSITEDKIQVVIMDPDLTSIQQRVLEKTWKCDVLDRTALILRIFQQRARTAAGQLQVQLAGLLYQKSRLVRAWTHLERQRGGFGFLGGPGESQLELDRRILETQTLRVKKQLEQVRKTRSLHRNSRRGYPSVALVGYTNTGKSTLFKALTKSDVLCADMPFATLDPTVRKVHLPCGHSVMLTDTVGFISELPSFLKLAFQATLEEIHEADLILHVRDKACANGDLQREDVLKLLKELKCAQPLLEVWNKADLVSLEERISGVGAFAGEEGGAKRRESVGAGEIRKERGDSVGAGEIRKESGDSVGEKGTAKGDAFLDCKEGAVEAGENPADDKMTSPWDKAENLIQPQGEASGIWISATEKTGLPELLAAISSALYGAEQGQDVPWQEKKLMAIHGMEEDAHEEEKSWKMEDDRGGEGAESGHPLEKEEA